MGDVRLVASVAVPASGEVVRHEVVEVKHGGHLLEFELLVVARACSSQFGGSWLLFNYRGYGIDIPAGQAIVK